MLLQKELKNKKEHLMQDLTEEKHFKKPDGLPYKAPAQTHRKALLQAI